MSASKSKKTFLVLMQTVNFRWAASLRLFAQSMIC